MKIKIVDVYEEKGQLRVIVEHDYGKDNIGLSLDAEYLGSDGQPKWKSEVKSLMDKKYGHIGKDKSLPKKHVFKEEVGKTFEIGGE